MAEVAVAAVSLIPVAKGFGGKIQSQIGGDVDRVGKSSGRKFGGAMSAGIGGAASKMFLPIAAGVAALGIGGLFKGAIDSASDLSESGSKVGVVFGKSAAQVVAASKTSATSMGLTEGAYLAANGTLGNLMVSLGIAPKAAAGMSQQMVTLASDMASFNNVPIEDALAALQSGLTGETEPLKAFGVNMNDATLKAEALKQGLIKSTKDAMSPQTKALAAQALIMAQTGTAQGDFARTSGGLANQQKILGAQLANIKTKIGGALLPAMTGLVTFLNGSIGPAFAGVGGGVKALGAAFQAGGSDVTSSGFAGGMERIGLGARVVVDFFKTQVIPGIRALVAAFQAGGSEVTSGGFAGGMERVGLAARVVANFFKAQVVPAIMGIVTAIRGFITVALPIVQAFVAGMMARIRPMLPTIRGIFAQIGQIIVMAMGLIQAIISRVTTVIAYVWKRWGGSIMSFISGVWSKIFTIVAAALGVIRGVIKTVTSVIKGDWSGAWTGIRLILSSAWSLIKGVISGALRVIGGVISGAWGLIKAGVSGAWNGIKSVISSAWDGIKSAISSKIGQVASTVRGLPGKILSAIGNLGSQMHAKGAAIIQGLIDGVMSKIGAVGSAIGSIAGKIADALPGSPVKKGPLKVLNRGYAGRQIVRMLADGMIDTVAKVTSATKKVTAKIAAVLASSYAGKGRDYGAMRALGGEVADDLMRFHMSSTTNKLSAIAAARERVAVKLKAAQTKLAAAVKVRNDFAANVRESFAAFGSVTAAEGGDIVALLTARLAAVKTFTTNLAKLKANGLNNTAYRQLVDAGVDGGGVAAASLAAGGKTVIGKVNSLQSQIGKAGASLGSAAARTLYQAGVDSASGLVRGLASQAKTLAAAASSLARALVKAVKRALGIRSPSTVMAKQGAFTALGLVKGIESQRDKVREAMTGLVGVPRTGSLDFASSTARSSAVAGIDYDRLASAMSRVQIGLDGRNLAASIDQRIGAGLQ